MGSFKLSALVAAALFAIPSAGALAADIPEPPYMPPLHFGGSWYLRGDIGFTNQHVGSLFNVLYSTATSVTNVQKSFDASPMFAVGFGYQHSDNLRFDFTGEYRSKANFHGLDIVTSGGVTSTDEYSGSKSELTFLANAYWDFAEWHGFRPFVGAGIGATYNTISSFLDVNTPLLGVAFGPTASKWSLAWAVYAGAGYQVTSNLTLEAAYRYIDLGSAQSGDLQTFTGVNAVVNPMEFQHLTSHDFKVGFRWALGHTPAYPPMVKY